VRLEDQLEHQYKESDYHDGNQEKPFFAKKSCDSLEPAFHYSAFVVLAWFRYAINQAEKIKALIAW
jgi:hypothetical protein